MSVLRKVLAACTAAWLCTSPAMGQTETAPKSKTAEETELLKERAALERARADVIAARLEPLTGIAGEGKTTLGEGAGQTEAWLLSSDALAAAASLISGELRGARYVVLAGDEVVSLRPLVAFNAEATSVTQQLDDAIQAAPAACGGGDGLNAAAAPLIPLIGSIAASLRTDTEARGITVDAKDRLLATALARELGSKAVVPSSLTMPAVAGSQVLAQLATIRGSVADARRLASCLAKDKKPSDRAKASATGIADALARATAFQTAVGTADASGSPPIANMLVLEAVAKDSPVHVRVYLDKANGTLLTRRNLWTALGASAVAVSGGVVASFVATDPATGRVEAAGVVRCATRLSGLRSIQDNTNPAANCRFASGPPRK